MVSLGIVCSGEASDIIYKDCMRLLKRGIVEKDVSEYFEVVGVGLCDVTLDFIMYACIK